ncbi:hypothetical protein CB0940_07640 [Cercospora beticola]|uniref:Uncharacterized protein n=1 Tax=Cercospora beticola TaxID=122368 RepID=A0A2G5H9T2_CERBT|nr:hypothetical protein CB0940_07640 [Cercospora beticola]PIA89295.1 hypothetical protein CB0940_07640 [Cercospora beticola]WPB03606.1 hypothetical protein RHO25_008246 [Cercospora beticola]
MQSQSPQFPKAPLGNHIPLFAILISVCLIGLAIAHFCIQKKAPTQKASPALPSRCSDDHDPHNPPKPPLIKALSSCRVEAMTYDADDELDSDDDLFSPLKLSADEAPSYNSGEIAKLTGLSTTSENIINSATEDFRASPNLIFAAAVLEPGAVLFSSSSSAPCPAQINAAAFSNNAHLSHSQSSQNSHATPRLHGATYLPQCTASLLKSSTNQGVLSIAAQHNEYKNVSLEAAFH